MSTETTGAGSLRERSKRGRRERILEAARELLRDDPERALTVERIAARADVSPGTVFNLVGKRDQIWAAITDEGLADLDLAHIGAEHSPSDRARAIVDAVLGMVIADAPVFRAAILNWTHSVQAIKHDPTDAVLQALRDGVNRGELRDDISLRRLAATISTGLIGLVHQWAAGLISDRTLRRHGRDLVDFAFLAAEKR